MQKVLLGVFLLSLLIMHDGIAQDTISIRERKWYAPDFAHLQYAGNIGFISGGVGFSSRLRNYQLALLYGYVPKAIAGVRIHTLTAKNTFPILRYPLKNNQTLIPYVGLGLSFEVGGNAFFLMPSHFPESYYDYPKNMRVLAYGGAKVQHLFQTDWHGVRGIEFFAEAGTVDLYVWYKAMSQEIKLNQIFSLAVGANILISY